MDKQEFADQIVSSVLPDVETLACLQVAAWSGDSLMMKFVLPEDDKQHDDFIKGMTDRFKKAHDDGKAGDFSLIFQRVQKSENEFMLLFKITPKV